MLNKTFSLRKIVLLCLALWIAPVSAQAGDALIKNEVEVDVTGKDAVDARAKAMKSAEVLGLKNMLERFTSPQQAQALMDTLSEDRISSLVRGIEVLDERISDRRYRAQLLVAFDGEEVNSLITAAGPGGGTVLESSVTNSFLIIPLYEEGSKTMLWEPDNAWRNTWRTLGLEAISSGVVVPYGDQTDAGTISVKNAKTSSFSSLSNLTNRYGTTDIIILDTKFAATPEMMLTVVRHRLNRTTNEAHILTYRADPEETKDMLLTRAALDIINGLQQMKNDDLKKILLGGERNNIMVLASISTISSWTQLRARLTELPMVEKVDVLAISPQQVDLNVRYRGDAESLESGILSKGLRLHKNVNYWVISRD